MAITIGHRGWLDLLSNRAGPKRKPVRVVQFIGDTGTFTVTNIGITNDAHVLTVIDVTTGKESRSPGEWVEAGTQGAFNHADTGSTTNVTAGNTMWAILSDSGPQSSA